MSDVMKIINHCTNIQNSIDTMWKNDVNNEEVNLKSESEIYENIFQIKSLLDSLENEYITMRGI